MAKTRSYTVGSEVYDIPEEKSEEFVKKFPKAVEVESFTVEKDTFDIPLDKVDSFVKAKPDAQPLKKKDSDQASVEVTEASVSDGSGFRTVMERDPTGQQAREEVTTEKVDSEIFTVDPEQTKEKQQEYLTKREEQYTKLKETVKPYIDQNKAFIEGELDKIAENQNYYTGAEIEEEFGDYPPIPNAFIRTKQVDRYKSARRLMDDVDKFMELPTDEGVKSMWKGLKSKGALDLLTLGYSEMFDQLNVADAAGKSRDGRKLSEDEELLLTTKYIMDQLRAGRDIPSTYNIGAGLAEMVPYVAQIALTSGISGGVSATAKQAAKGQLKKIISKYGLAELAGAAAAAPFTGIMWESVGEKRTGQLEVGEDGKVKAIAGTEESPREAIAKAWTNTAIELFTEKFVGEQISNFKLMGRNANKALKSPEQLKNIQKGMKDFRKIAKWDGLVSEWGEEQVSAVMQAITTGDASIKDLFDVRNQLEMLGTIAVANGVFKATEIPGYLSKGADKNAYEAALNGLKIIEDEGLRKQAIEDVTGSKNIKDLRERMSERGYEQLEPFQQEAIVRFMTAKMEKDAIDGMREAPVDEAEDTQAVTAEELQKPEEMEKAEPVKAEKVKGKEEAPKETIKKPAVEKEPGVTKTEVKKQQKQIDILEGEKSSLEETLKAVPEDEKVKIKKEITDIDNQIQTLKTEEDGKKMQQKKRVNEIGEESNRQEKPQEDQREGQKDEILAQPEYSALVEIAAKAETPKEFKDVFNKANLPSEIQDKFYRAYDVGGKNTVTTAGKEFISDVKQKTKEDASKVGQVREEGQGQKSQLQEKSKPVRSVYEVNRADQIGKAVENVGPVQDKSKKQLVEEAQSVEELDYLVANGKIPFNSLHHQKKADLRDAGKMEDTGRIEALDSQYRAAKAPQVEDQLKKDLGAKKYEDLKVKKQEKISSVSDRLARLANSKFAIGEDGAKPDVIKEIVGLVKDLAELGVVNLELGSRAAIEKLKTYINDKNTQKAVKQNEKAIIKALSEEGIAVDKPKSKPGAAAKEKKTEPPKEKPPEKTQIETKPKEPRKSSVILAQSIANEKASLKSIQKTNKDRMVKLVRKMFVDKSENFRVGLIKEDPKFGQRAVDYFNLQSGISGKTSEQFDTARKKILGKVGSILPGGEQLALEQYLKLKRIVELDSLYDKRGDERLLHPENLNKEEAQSVIDDMVSNDPDTMKVFGLESLDMDKIEQRAEYYWDVMRDNLEKLNKAGIVGDVAYNKLKEEQPYYNRREYLQHFIDGVDKGGSLSGIDALSSGSLGSVMTDLQTLLADNLNRTNSMISRTKTMKALKDFAIENPSSDIVKEGKYTQEHVKALLEEQEKPEAEQQYIPPQWQETPRGYTEIDFRDGGADARIFINNELVDEFINTSDPEWLNKVTNGLSWITGTKILKAFATGYNPEFMIKNIPLDMLHILTTTEYYSPLYPVATAQLMSDIKTVLPDVVGRKGRFKEYVQEGGNMDFLTTQGSLAPKKFRNYTDMTAGVKALADGAAFLGNTSELLTRIALRERVIKNNTEQFVKDNGRDPDIKELQEINERATAAARNYLDFSQGGHAVKLLNSVIPYLNAGFQVTRGSLRAAKNNPKIFSMKVAQLAATATAITAYNLGMFSGGDDEEKEERKNYYLSDISDRVKADNFVIMTPVKYQDRSGNTRYVYFKFPKDNMQKSITGVFEGALMEATGVKGGLINKQRWLEVESLMQNVTDLGNLPPIQRAPLGYQLNTDLYFKEPLWNGRDLGDNKSEEYVPGRTPERFIRFGEITGLSPIRSQYFVQQFTTRSNVLGTIIGEGLDFAAAGFDEEIQNTLNQSASQRLTTAPFTRRFFKATSPYVKKSRAKEEQQKENRIKQKNDNEYKKLIKSDKEPSEIVKWIVSTGPNESDRLLRKYINTKTKGNIDYRVREMAFISPKPRARVFYELYKDASEKGREKLLKQSFMMGGIMTQGEFMVELVTLMAQDENLRKDIKKLNEK